MADIHLMATPRKAILRKADTLRKAHIQTKAILSHITYLNPLHTPAHHNEVAVAAIEVAC